MTIDVPPAAVPLLEQLVKDLARELGEDPSPALESMVVATVLSHGIAAMRGPKGEIVMVVKNGKGGVR